MTQRIDDESVSLDAGRANDVIIRGGSVIFSVEIERALRSHPLVRDAAAFGVPDPELGQCVAAVVQLDSESDDAAIDRILAAISERLPSYKVPELMVAVDAVPRGPLGEVDRQALAEAILGIPAHRHLQ